MPDNTQELETRIENLEKVINYLVSSDRYTIQKDVQVFDGRDFIFANGTGTKFGTEVGQKLAFYGVTPVDQPTTISDPAGGGTVDTQARTAINTIIDRLQELGLIA